MHEWLITRGDAERAPFVERIRIFVAVNCVLVHAGECHAKAQHTDEGKKLCMDHVLSYHGKQDILSWLDNVHLQVVEEARRYVE